MMGRARTMPALSQQIRQICIILCNYHAPVRPTAPYKSDELGPLLAQALYRPGAGPVQAWRTIFIRT